MRDQELYVGMSNDLRKRLSLHNKGKVPATHKRFPFQCIYYEAHRNKYDAAAREQFLKTGWGKNWIKRVLHYSFQSKKLGGQAHPPIEERIAALENRGAKGTS